MSFFDTNQLPSKVTHLTIYRDFNLPFNLPATVTHLSFENDYLVSGRSEGEIDFSVDEDILGAG